VKAVDGVVDTEVKEIEPGLAGGVTNGVGSRSGSAAVGTGGGGIVYDCISASSLILSSSLTSLPDGPLKIVRELA
jgi:hypothetical protein